MQPSAPVSEPSPTEFPPELPQRCLNSQLLLPNSKLLSSISYLLSPLFYLLSPISHLLSPNSSLLSPISFLLTPIPYLLTPISFYDGLVVLLELPSPLATPAQQVPGGGEDQRNQGDIQGNLHQP